MTGPDLTSEEVAAIDHLVQEFETRRELVSNFLDGVDVVIRNSSALSPMIHSIRSRMKDPTNLKGKLMRKLKEAKGEGRDFAINKDNLLVSINDLAGIRLLHLHTRQIKEIDPVLRQLFEEQQYRIVEGPIAKTWDDESRAFFESCGITTEKSETLYTSVHYVIESNSKTKVTCEVQVRTLSEEVWGEVDHKINYPDKVGSLACREQIAVLARATSAATRLVDAIFATYDDYRKTDQSKQ